MTRRYLVPAFAAMLVVVGLVQFLPMEATGGRPIFAASVQIATGAYALNTQVPCDIETAPDGTIYALFMSDHTFRWGVYLSRSEDEGATWSIPSRVDDILRDGNVSNDNRSAKQHPRMAVGNDGMIYVVWEDHRKFVGDDPISRPVEIRFSKSFDKGETFTPSVKIDPVKAEKIWHGFQPDIAINGDGRLVVVWQDMMNSGSHRNIYSIHSTDGGDTWSSAVLLNTDGLYFRNHLRPRIVMHGDDVYITWHDNRNLTLGFKPVLAVSHDGGSTFYPEINITDDTEENQVRVDAEPAVDDAGNLYILWSDSRAGYPEIWMTRSEDRGSTLHKNFRVTRVPERATDNRPVIAATNNGVVAMSFYRENFNIQGDKIERTLYYLNSSDGGRSWGNMLRVDDTDRFKEDLTDQEFPQITYTPEGRAILCWSDQRNYLPMEVYRDLFFGRHSQSLTGPNYLPGMREFHFKGPFEFDWTIGNGSTVFDFDFIYSDYDNDMPRAGYPRMRIFNDELGLDPFSEYIPMVKKDESDIYYIEGVSYHAQAMIPVEGEYYWGVEIMEERDPTLLRSNIFPGPRIDTTPPSVVMLGPEEFKWMDKDRIPCSGRVTDTGGSHVDPASIKYQRSISTPSDFERGVVVASTDRIDNNTYNGFADVMLSQGKQNYVRFEARDRVGNGPTISEYITLWVDSQVPYFIQMRPATADIQIYADVNCSIIWMDHLPGGRSERSIGIEPSSIMYRYRTTNQGFGEWSVPDRVIPLEDEQFLSYVNLKFSDKGVYNYIQWRASDLLGNLRETPEVRINVNIPLNYAPVFKGGAYPSIINSETPHIWWDDAYDEEGDRLYYKVMLMNHGDLYQFSDDIQVGRRTFFDIPDTQKLTPGYWKLRINVTDRIGGWDVLTHTFRVVDFGDPPPAETPQVGPYYLPDTNRTIEWGRSASHNSMEVNYSIRLGSERFMNDIMDWTDVGSSTEYALNGLGLDIGMYSFQVMAHNNGNFSRVSEGMIKINDYRVDLLYPETHLTYRGSGSLKSKPMEIGVINLGTYMDNVTLFLEGELADDGWAYFSDTRTDIRWGPVSSSSGLTSPDLWRSLIVIYPPATADTGEYTLYVRAVSEDNMTVIVSEAITVRIREAPDDSKGNPLGEGLYNLITDIFPFLSGLSQGLVLFMFLLLALLIIILLAVIGIMIVKRTQKKKTDDPYEKQKQIYRELYGAEPPEGYTGEEKVDDGFDVDKLFNEGSKAPEKGSNPDEGVEEVEPSVEEPVEDEGDIPEKEDAPKIQKEDGGFLTPD